MSSVLSSATTTTATVTCPPMTKGGSLLLASSSSSLEPAAAAASRTPDLTVDGPEPQPCCTTPAPPQTSRIKLGTRVSVYWDGEKQYFDGVIDQIKQEETTKYYVRYDDGDQEWIDLEKVLYKVLPKGDDSINGGVQQQHHVAKDPWSLPPSDQLSDNWVATYNLPAHCNKDSSDDDDTDEEELARFAITALGAPSYRCFYASAMEGDRYCSISEKVKLGRRRGVCGNAVVKGGNKKGAYTGTTVKTKKRKKNPSLKSGVDNRNLEEAKRKKDQAKPLTHAQVEKILEEDPTLQCPSSHWVRRSMRQPNKSALTSSRVRDLLAKLRVNDTDMVVLKMKKYVNDPDSPSIVIDAVLDALEENSNCQALYIQNFNAGMRDEQVLKLLSILQRPTCNIWCLNIGETYKVNRKTWRRFAKGLKHSKVTHMYASEHTISGELKEQIRKTIRDNRKKHSMHNDPNNLDTIVQCTHCWWNPVNAKVLQPYLHKKGYDSLLRDAEAQGLRGSTSGATLT